MKNMNRLLMYLPNLEEITLSSVLSFLYAVISSLFFKEVIHMVSVIVTAIITTIIVHIVKYKMQKRLPLGKKELEDDK